MMLASVVAVFGSDRNDDGSKVLQDEIAQLNAQCEKIEKGKKENEIETKNLHRKIDEANSGLRKIENKKQLAANYGKNAQHAETIEKTVAIGEKVKNQRSYSDEDAFPCEDAFRFVRRTHKLRKADYDIKNAIIYGRDATEDGYCGYSLFNCFKITLTGCGFCCYPHETMRRGCDCCGFYNKRDDAKYRLTASMALAREKLVELKTEQKKYLGKQVKRENTLSTVIREAVVSQVIEDRGEEKKD